VMILVNTEIVKLLVSYLSLIVSGVIKVKYRKCSILKYICMSLPILIE